MTGTTTNVAGTLTYNATTRVATFTPAAPLAQTTSYTFTVTGVRDLQNNAMASASVTTFTTGDLTAPTVTAVLPANNATAGRNSTVQITFSEAMDQTTINSTNIVLRNTGTSAIVPATVTYNSTTNVATLTPTGPLSNATQYTLTVSTAVRDIFEQPLASVPRPSRAHSTTWRRRSYRERPRRTLRLCRRPLR